MSLIEKLTVVLCLAGKGKRFIDEGIDTPKFLLTNHYGQKILDLIVKNLKLSKISKVILIVNKKHVNYKKEILEIMNKHKEVEFDIFYIEDTSGQAETALLATDLIRSKFPKSANLPIAFHNGDTIICNREFDNFLSNITDHNWHGIVDTFYSKDPKFSYVRTVDKQIVEIKEKVVISNMATTGFYLFSSLDLYRKSYKRCDFKGEEPYISNVYEFMISQGSKILNLYNKDPDNTIVLGTPQQYLDWLHNG